MLIKVLATVALFVIFASLGFSFIICKKEAASVLIRKRIIFIISGSLFSVMFFISYIIWQDPFMKSLSDLINDEGYTMTVIITTLLCFLVHFFAMSVINGKVAGKGGTAYLRDRKKIVLTALYSLIVIVVLEIVFIFLHVT